MLNCVLLLRGCSSQDLEVKCIKFYWVVGPSRQINLKNPSLAWILSLSVCAAFFAFSFSPLFSHLPFDFLIWISQNISDDSHSCVSGVCWDCGFPWPSWTWYLRTTLTVAPNEDGGPLIPRQNLDLSSSFAVCFNGCVCLANTFHSASSWIDQVSAGLFSPLFKDRFFLSL